jgi:hypothetical protein
VPLTTLGKITPLVASAAVTKLKPVVIAAASALVLPAAATVLVLKAILVKAPVLGVVAPIGELLMGESVSEPPVIS